MTGIEQIGYLTNLRKPAASPTLQQIGDYFFEKKKLSDNWERKSRRFWREFMDAVGALTAREVLQDKILDYFDQVKNAGHGPPYVRQRFEAVKAIINFPVKRRMWIDVCKYLHEMCSVLVKPSASDAMPRPIHRKAFQALLDHADQQTKAIFLAMLNFCMYGGEVVDLQWGEVDLERGTLVTRRNKTGVIRVAVLWPCTAEALRILPRLADHIFITDGTKMQHNYQTVYKALKRVRNKASLTDVQLGDIREWCIYCCM